MAADKQTKQAIAIEILMQTLEENPSLWDTRKKTARLLFEEERYEEASEIVWRAPEIPASDVDVAFALRVIARCKPNRAIRLMYEVLRRNQGKPEKNMAIARALNEEDMHMAAAKFYGMALGEDSSVLDLAFESQLLWSDVSGRLIEEWRKSDPDAKNPLDVANELITGGVISTSQLDDVEPSKDSSAASAPEPPQPAEAKIPAVVKKPAAQAKPMSPMATNPLIVPSAGLQKTPLHTSRVTGRPAVGEKPSAPPSPAIPPSSPSATPPSESKEEEKLQSTNPKILKGYSGGVVIKNPVIPKSDAKAGSSSDGGKSNPLVTQPMTPPRKLNTNVPKKDEE